MQKYSSGDTGSLKIQLTTEQILFDLSLSICILIKGFGLTDGPIYKSGLILAFLLAFGKLLTGRYNRLQKTIIVLFTVLGVISCYISREPDALMWMMLILSMKNVSIKRAFSLEAVLWTGTFVIQALISLFQTGSGDYVIHSKYGLGFVIRWALGYSHPNVLQIVSCVIVFSWLFLLPVAETEKRSNRSYRKTVIRALVLSALFEAYVFLYSLSSTGILMYLIFLVFLLYFEWNRRKNRRRSKAEDIILTLIFPLCVVVSIICPIVLRGRAFDIINELFNTRPNLTRIYLTEFGLNLLGKNFSFMKRQITLDCSYMYLLMHQGVILFAAVMILYFFLIRDTLKKSPSWENSCRLAILISTAAAAVSEPFAFNSSFKNVTLLFAGEYLYEKTSRFGMESAWLSNFDALRNAGERLNSAGGKKHTVLDLPGSIISFLAWLCSQGAKYRKKVFLTAAIATAISVCIYAGAAHIPGSMILSRQINCDREDLLYFNEQEIGKMRDDPEIWILSYQGPDDPMDCFTTDDSPNIFRMEKIRGYVSTVLWSGLIFGSAAVICYAGKRRTRRSVKNDDTSGTAEK